jgi:tight adherence protein C
VTSALLFFIGAAGLAWLALAPRAGDGLRQRARTVREKRAAGPELEDELALPFLRRVLRPTLNALFRALTRVTPRGLQRRARERLAHAGLHTDAARFIATKTLVAGATLVGFLVVIGLAAASDRAGQLTVIAIIATLLAYSLPEVWLSRAIGRRRKSYQRALPDVMDLLCVSVEAGLGFDGAVQKVAEKFPPPIGEEFREYLKEVKLGKPRPEALRSLSARSGLPEVQSFAAAVIQAEELGVSITKVLRVQSEQLRQRRKQRAEEKAMKTPIKMLFPLIIFIFPTVFIVVLGPALLSLVEMFKR